MKTISKFLVALLLLPLFSCEDILEEDITNDMVVPVSPLENQEILSNVVNFRWNTLKGADSYRLQVYTSGEIVLDSLVSSNNFTKALTPGNYQWRVRGENFAYETAYTFPVNFKLTETDDLSKQQVPLLTPLSGIYSSNPALTFNWTSLKAATSYAFQLLNVTAGNTVLLQQNDLQATTFSLPQNTIAQDGQYSWQVKAVNEDNNTETDYSTRSFYIDRTAPNAPQNSLPANDHTVTSGTEMSFEWRGGTDTGVVISPVTYTVQIATDTGFTNVLQNGTTANTSYSYTFTAAGTYYWRVRSKDNADNFGAYSSYFKITVQ